MVVHRLTVKLQRTLLIALGGAVLFGGLSSARGQSVPERTKNGQTTATAPAKAAPAVPAAPASEELKKILIPPKGDDVAVLEKYLSDTLGYEPKTPADAQAFNDQAPVVLTKVATRILELQKDSASAGFLLARRYLIAMDVMAVGSATPAERRELVEILCDSIKQPTVSPDDVEISIALVDEFEGLGDIDSAKFACQNFSEVYLASQDESMVELGNLMASAARRFGLVGNSVDISGELVGARGKAFDWKALRGKVVLIDFWSTSCGPCRQEFPRLKELHQAYRARGFEIVGINMDEDAKVVEDFLKTEKLPWITLQEKANDTKAPSVQYGVLNLPTTFLVDKQGKVVSLNARGEALAKSLETMLGPEKVRR
jgi:thiol-disulfide isomerase/thioredoxin